jgi:hypothetical protein
VADDEVQDKQAGVKQMKRIQESRLEGVEWICGLTGSPTIRRQYLVNLSGQPCRGVTVGKRATGLGWSHLTGPRHLGGTANEPGDWVLDGGRLHGRKQSRASTSAQCKLIGNGYLLESQMRYLVGNPQSRLALRYVGMQPTP